MNDLLSLISRHGYLFLAVVCFAEAVGLPLPAALAMLTAGAVAAYGGLHFYLVFGIALLAMISGDVILYFMGRVSGWALLGFLCRLSANPETCILRSAEYFYRRGKQTLLFAKFIPGINTMSPPLAGSMKMRLGVFLQFDALGAALYVGAYSVAGYPSVTRCAPSHADCAPPALPLKSSSASDLSRMSSIESGFTASTACSTSFHAYRPRSSQKAGVRCGSEHADRRCPQPRLLRCRLRTHCRIDSHRTQQPHRRSQEPAQGSRDLSLLYLSTRSHERPGGAPITGTRIQGVRHRRRPARLAQGWAPGGASAARRPGQAADLHLKHISVTRLLGRVAAVCYRALMGRTPSFCGVILAAGDSSRMGRDKALLPWPPIGARRTRFSPLPFGFSFPTLMSCWS